MHIGIIGAGISGLSMAIALEKHGFQVSIFEKSSCFSPIGAGILLAPNAMNVYRDLNIAQQLIDRGNKIHELEVVNIKNRVLNHFAYKEFLSTSHPWALGLSRTNLIDVLRTNLQNSPIHLNKEFSHLQQNNNVEVTFKDQSSIKVDILLAADGFHSKVRDHLFGPPAKRDAKQVCFRGLCYSSELSLKPFQEVWGEGKRVGYVNLGHGQIYWYMTFCNKLYPNIFSTPLKELIKYFDNWPQHLQTLITETNSENIIRHQLEDIPPAKRWHKGNVCLLGDAIHPTTPNLGQGAAMGIESASSLAHALVHHSRPEVAFSTFSKQRQARTKMITNTSWLFGKLANISDPLLMKVRDLAMTSQPKFFKHRQLRKIYSKQQN